MTRRSMLASVAAIAAAPVVTRAQGSRVYRFVVGFPPGGSTDVAARLLAESVRSQLPLPLLVENRPGAAGRLAIDHVKAAEPDGLTALVTADAMFTVYPHVYRRLSYDPVKDFAPVAQFVSFPLMVSVGPGVPPSVRTLADFLVWAKANPTKATYGSPGAGTVNHFVGVSLAKTSGVPLAHVAFKGDAPAIQDMLGGHIAMSVNVPAAQLPHISSGRMRVLATTGPKRMAELPDVPTLVESGFPEMKTNDWFGVFVPAKAPHEEAARLESAIKTAMQSATLRDALQKQGLTADFASGAALGQKLKSDLAFWSGIVKSSGFSIDE